MLRSSLPRTRVEGASPFLHPRSERRAIRSASGRKIFAIDVWGKRLDDLQVADPRRERELCSARRLLAAEFQRRAAFSAPELLRAGYGLGRGDQEPGEAESAFSGNGWNGGFRIATVMGCDEMTDWVRVMFSPLPGGGTNISILNEEQEQYGIKTTRRITAPSDHRLSLRRSPR